MRDPTIWHGSMVLNGLPLTGQTSLTTHKGYYDDNDHTSKIGIVEIPLILKQTVLNMSRTVKTKNMNSLHVRGKCESSMMRSKQKKVKRLLSYFILRVRVKAVKPY